MTADEVKSIEASLGITLPNDYKKAAANFPFERMARNNYWILYDDPESIINHPSNRQSPKQIKICIGDSCFLRLNSSQVEVHDEDDFKLFESYSDFLLECFRIYVSHIEYTRAKFPCILILVVSLISFVVAFWLSKILAAD